MAERRDAPRFDVVIIGAGGAGLRAAIEAQRARAPAPRWSASPCSARRTPSWPRAASPPPSATSGREDNWQVHFRDTMRGGKMLNNWRMAQLHAEEAPDRVLELEEWGALFDRTPDGRILQRDFGGHRYARLAHVGDRTGLEMIRTLQHRAVDLGIEVFMECKIVRLLHGRRRGGERGARLLARERASSSSSAPSRSCSPTGGVGKTWKFTSNSWESTGDGHALALWAGADLIDMECVQFHPTGMVWPPSARGLLVTEGVRGDGGVLRNRDGERFMFNYIPAYFAAETADTHRRGRPVVRQQEGLPPPARAAAPRRGRPSDQHRGEGGPRQPARRGVPRHRDRRERRVHQASPALDVPPVQGTGRRRHHQPSRWRSARPATTSWAACGSTPTPRPPRSPGLYRRRRGRRRDARRQPPRRQFALRPARLRAARRRAPPPSTPSASGHASRARRRSGRRDHRSCPRVLRATTAARTPTPSTRTAGHDAETSSASSAPRPSCIEAKEQARRARRAGEEGLRGGQPPVQPRLAPRPRPRVDAGLSRWCTTLGASSARRAGAATPARTTRRRTPSSAR